MQADGRRYSALALAAGYADVNKNLMPFAHWFTIHLLSWECKGVVYNVSTVVLGNAPLISGDVY